MNVILLEVMVFVGLIYHGMFYFPRFVVNGKK